MRKPLPKGVAIAAAVLGVLVVTVAVYFLAVSPKRSELSDVRHDTTTTQQQIDALRAEAANRDSTPDIRVADVYRLAKAMPAQADMPDVLLELSAVAREAGIELDTVTPQPLEPGAGSYQILPITLTFSGNYYSVHDLLHRLRTLVAVRHGELDARGRLFSVKSMNLTPSGDILNVSLDVDAYVFGGVPAEVPGATDTTSTDTTSTTTPAAPGASAAGPTP
ncbi:MAG TPA: type 4a pilus biogenesis protein PilO [Gaiellaceae bacterium]|jgi:Tfp pilus assembly protein PilO